MGKSVTIAVLACLLIGTYSSTIKLNLSEVKLDSTHHRHHAANNLGQNAGKDTITNEQNTALTDIQINVNLAYGSKTVKQVLDTTSFYSWVYAKNPQTAAACINSPQGSEPFSCDSASGCKPTAYTTEVTAFAHGGRVSESFQFAQQDHVTYDQQTIKNYDFGLAYNIRTGRDQLDPKTGNLGLGFGSVQQQYNKAIVAQLHAPTPDPKLQTSNNFVQQFHLQNKGIVPATQFAIKLEDQLSLLNIGNVEGYFVNGKFTEYQNQGSQLWALSVTSFSIGADKYDLTQANGTPAAAGAGTGTHTEVAHAAPAHAPPPEQNSRNLPLAAFDSTTKFFWVSADVQQGIVNKLNANAQHCTINVIINCQGKIEDFKPLKFQFNNLAKTTIEVPAVDYIDKAANGVFLNFIAFPAGYDTHNVAPDGQKLILLGSSIFKSNYIVFNQHTNTIKVAPSYPVNPSPLYIQRTAHIVYIVIGSILILFALVTLLSILKQIDPSTITETKRETKPEPVITQSRPQPVYYQSQQVQYGPPLVVGQPVLGGSRTFPARR